MPSKVELTVVQGEIIVNSGWCIVDQPDCVIWEFDLGSKYPEGAIWLNWSDLNHDGDDQNETMSVHLFAGERTLRSNSDAGRPTMITGRVDAPNEKWTIVADWARYSVRVCFYKYPPQDAERDLEIYTKDDE